MSQGREPSCQALVRLHLPYSPVPKGYMFEGHQRGACMHSL